MPDNPTLITTKELSKILRKSQTAIRCDRSRGLGPPFYRTGGRRGRCLYDVAEVRAWLESKRQDPEAATDGDSQR